MGERGADASPYTTSERDPGPGGWAPVQEAIHAPGRGLLVHVRAPVDEQAAGGDRRPGRELSAGDRHRMTEPPEAAHGT